MCVESKVKAKVSTNECRVFIIIISIMNYYSEAEKTTPRASWHVWSHHEVVPIVIYPSTHTLSSAYPRSGHRDNRSRRETQTFLSCVTLSSSSWMRLYNPSSVFWVCSEASTQASSHLDMPKNSPKGGEQEAS